MTQYYPSPYLVDRDSSSQEQLCNGVMSSMNVSKLTIMHVIMCSTNHRLTIAIYANR